MISAIVNAMASNWIDRPDDDWFPNLVKLAEEAKHERLQSKQLNVSVDTLHFVAGEDDGILAIQGPSNVVFPTHFAFSRLAAFIGAPPIFMRSLPAELAAEVLNFIMETMNEKEFATLLTKSDDGRILMRTVTGLNYGRIWNYTIAEELVKRFGDGVHGDWSVPGKKKGRGYRVTKNNSTFFVGEKDMHVFLTDEKNKIEIPGRGLMSRGFYISNSEVGDSPLSAAWFLYDEVTQSRVVWGTGEYSEKRVRHTLNAPDKWLEQLSPVLDHLTEYSNASEKTFLEPIQKAQEAKVEDPKSFLRKRFQQNPRLNIRSIPDIIEAPSMVEGTDLAVNGNHPVETLWDVTQAVSTFAKTLPNQDQRVALEVEAGRILALAT